MKKFGKLAAVCALTAAFAVLTACGGENVPAPLPQSQQQVQNSQIAGGNTANSAENLITELDEQIIKSKVTSADSTAKAFIDTVNVYISAGVILGGKNWESGTIKISVKNGKWTSSGYNADAYNKPDKPGMPDIKWETLLERFQMDFPEIKNSYAEIHINEDGKAYAAIFSPSGKLDDSEYPDETAFENEKWKWDGKTVGVTPKGNILGTCPRLFLDEG